MPTTLPLIPQLYDFTAICPVIHYTKWRQGATFKCLMMCPLSKRGTWYPNNFSFETVNHKKLARKNVLKRRLQDSLSFASGRADLKLGELKPYQVRTYREPDGRTYVCRIYLSDVLAGGEPLDVMQVKRISNNWKGNAESFEAILFDVDNLVSFSEDVTAEKVSSVASMMYHNARIMFCDDSQYDIARLIQQKIRWQQTEAINLDRAPELEKFKPESNSSGGAASLDNMIEKFQQAVVEEYCGSLDPCFGTGHEIVYRDFMQWAWPFTQLTLMSGSQKFMSEPDLGVKGRFAQWYNFCSRPTTSPRMSFKDFIFRSVLSEDGPGLRESVIIHPYYQTYLIASFWKMSSTLPGEADIDHLKSSCMLDSLMYANMMRCVPDLDKWSRKGLAEFGSTQYFLEDASTILKRMGQKCGPDCERSCTAAKMERSFSGIYLLTTAGPASGGDILHGWRSRHRLRPDLSNEEFGKLITDKHNHMARVLGSGRGDKATVSAARDLHQVPQSTYNKILAITRHGTGEEEIRTQLKTLFERKEERSQIFRLLGREPELAIPYMARLLLNSIDRHSSDISRPRSGAADPESHVTQSADGSNHVTPEPNLLKIKVNTKRVIVQQTPVVLKLNETRQNLILRPGNGLSCDKLDFAKLLHNLRLSFYNIERYRIRPGAQVETIKYGFYMRGRETSLWGMDPVELVHYVCGALIRLEKAQSTCQLILVPDPTVIMGDIHGQLHILLQLEQMFWRHGAENSPTNVLFCGDYMDRGKNSLEVVLLLFCQRLLAPDKFFLLRGNHECIDTNNNYKVAVELEQRFGSENGAKIYELINVAFDYLPVSAIVGGQVFCAHGGIPAPSLLPTGHISDLLEQPVPQMRTDGVPPPSALDQIMWNDPIGPVMNTGFEVWRRENGFFPSFGRRRLDRWGVSHLSTMYHRNMLWSFTDKSVEEFDIWALKDFLHNNNLSCVIRAHQVQRKGIQVQKEGLLATVFSSSLYPASEDAPIQAGVILARDNKLHLLTISNDLNALDSTFANEYYPILQKSIPPSKNFMLKYSWDEGCSSEEPSPMVSPTMQKLVGDGSVKWEGATFVPRSQPTRLREDDEESMLDLEDVGHLGDVDEESDDSGAETAEYEDTLGPEVTPYYSEIPYAIRDNYEYEVPAGIHPHPAGVYSEPGVRQGGCDNRRIAYQGRFRGNFQREDIPNTAHNERVIYARSYPIRETPQQQQQRIVTSRRIKRAREEAEPEYWTMMPRGVHKQY